VGFLGFNSTDSFFLGLFSLFLSALFLGEGVVGQAVVPTINQLNGNSYRGSCDLPFGLQTSPNSLIVTCLTSGFIINTLKRFDFQDNTLTVFPLFGPKTLFHFGPLTYMEPPGLDGTGPISTLGGNFTVNSLYGTEVPNPLVNPAGVLNVNNSHCVSITLNGDLIKIFVLTSLVQPVSPTLCPSANDIARGLTCSGKVNGALGRTASFQCTGVLIGSPAAVSSTSPAFQPSPHHLLLVLLFLVTMMVFYSSK